MLCPRKCELAAAAGSCDSVRVEVRLSELATTKTWMHRVNLFYLFIGRHRMANLGRRVFHDSEAHSHRRGFSFKSLNRQTE